MLLTVIVIRNYCVLKFEPSGNLQSKSQRKVYLQNWVEMWLTCVIINLNHFRARIFNQIQIPARETSRSLGSRLRRSPLAIRDRLVGKRYYMILYDTICCQVQMIKNLEVVGAFSAKNFFPNKIIFDDLRPPPIAKKISVSVIGVQKFFAHT